MSSERDRSGFGRGIQTRFHVAAWYVIRWSNITAFRSCRPRICASTSFSLGWYWESNMVAAVIFRQAKLVLPGHTQYMYSQNGFCSIRKLYANVLPFPMKKTDKNGNQTCSKIPRIPTVTSGLDQSVTVPYEQQFDNNANQTCLSKI